MTKKKTPRLCQHCQAWDSFGERCWFYWEEKKECANHTDGFRSIKEHFELDSTAYHHLVS